MPPIDYSKWDNLSYSSSSDGDEKEENEEKEELNKNMQNIVIKEPSKLWMLVTDWPDVFEKHVLLSGYLNETDIKMFYECCRASRRAVIRANIKLYEVLLVNQLSSISTLELAWKGYPWGSTIRFILKEEFTMDPEFTMNQEFFCWRVAETNDLKLLRWIREEKECAWDAKTSGMAADNGNLDMLKYCCENGCEINDITSAAAAGSGHLECLEYLRSKNCPWDTEVCEFAHKHNHMDVLTYAVKNKCPGYEEYERFIPK
jgi:hypothetical protein